MYVYAVRASLYADPASPNKISITTFDLQEYTSTWLSNSGLPGGKMSEQTSMPTGKPSQASPSTGSPFQFGRSRENEDANLEVHLVVD